MTDGKEKKTIRNEQEQETDIRGRIHNSQNPELEHQGADRDISSVDQQEGDMNNGETGANLQQPERGS